MELTYKSVAELAPMIQCGELSPVELAKSCLDRITRVDPILNAFLDVWGDQAMETAEVAENEIAKGNYRGALHGIPVGLKDLIDVAGTPTTGGSKVLADN
ncbi:MAG: Asp-tRNA(Asn)/Glu-tRNA(Gln) amidotransferase GatCAB subunit A, partial [Chloroflexi bacterium]|nr:Asp-tRNA(Asn)/Glu-tRNA(Gln) amidotransferase GatCAB subunit A [Chloroflexota bacterium]